VYWGDDWGDWKRETWHRETISQGWTSRDRTTRHQIKQIATGWTSVGPRKNWTCWTISERIKSCLSRFYSGDYIVACSFCVQSAILSALIRSPYSRGSTTEVTATAARTKTRTGMALAVPAALTSGASESATAAAATTSDDCCEVCIVATRAGFALVPRGHRTRRQYTRRRNDDKETFRNWSISQSHNNSLFYSAPKRCPESWPT